MTNMQEIYILKDTEMLHFRNEKFWSNYEMHIASILMLYLFFFYDEM